MRWVTTQVSDPKTSTTCTTAFKNKLYTWGAPTYLLRMRVILLQNSLAQDKFLAKDVQSSSTANITRPRYLK